MQHRKFAVYDITEIAILYLLTEGLRGMKFPLSTIYATYAHMIAYAYQSSTIHYLCRRCFLIHPMRTKFLRKNTYNSLLLRRYRTRKILEE